MKIKSGYMLREVAGNHIVVPTGKAALDFNGMMRLNESGTLLWKCLAEDKEEEELLSSLLKVYKVDVDTAKNDISEFITKLKMANLLD